MASDTASKPRRLSERDGRLIRARYDAAQSTDDNRRHWAAADGLSAEATNSLAVRTLLRNRARYEVGNNSYLDGILGTLANDTVGTGPRPQMLTEVDAFDSAVEAEFEAWAEEVALDERLRTMRRAKAESGEVFAFFAYNPGLAGPVKLDLELVEADQVTDPTWQSVTDPQWCDGIRFDPYGNPASYRRLKQHPGAAHYFTANPLDFDDVDARWVFHYFPAKRPGQRRGVPEITPALSNWPELRRYCNAVIAAAETAAEYAITIQSEAPPDGDSADDPEAMDTFELQKRMATVLPKGWSMQQTKAEHPTTTYGGFVDKKLAEAARCLQMPFTIAALDSSSANLSARYLDSQIYAKAVKIERQALRRPLNRLLDLWLTEAFRVPGLLPSARLPDGGRVRRQWCWPGIGEHADPDKVAKGQAQRLRNGTTSLPDELAEQGQDWEDVAAKNAKALGVPVEEYRRRLFDTILPPAPAPAAAAGGEAPDDGDDE